MLLRRTLNRAETLVLLSLSNSRLRDIISTTTNWNMAIEWGVSIATPAHLEETMDSLTFCGRMYSLTFCNMPVPRSPGNYLFTSDVCVWAYKYNQQFECVFE